MVSPCPRPRCSRDIGQAPASLSSRTHANRKRKCTSFPGNDKSLGLAFPWGRSVPCDCGQQDGMYVPIGLHVAYSVLGFQDASAGSRGATLPQAKETMRRQRQHGPGLLPLVTAQGLRFSCFSLRGRQAIPEACRRSICFPKTS